MGTKTRGGEKFLLLPHPVQNFLRYCEENEEIMKSFALICFAMLALGGSALAQKDITDKSSGAVEEGTGLRTVMGCLSKTDKTYVITGGAPGPKQFRLVSGDVSSLKGKIGHTIEVVGIVSKNDASANQNGIYNEGTTTGVGYLTVDVQKIKQIYGNCSEPGKEWAGDHI